MILMLNRSSLLPFGDMSLLRVSELKVLLLRYKQELYYLPI